MEPKLPAEEQIRARAHEIYLARGGQPGHEMDDWLQAEYELIRLPVRKIVELESPPPKRSRKRRSALVALVQLAMLYGAEALAHFDR
jgi:hypothetical protein